MAAAVLVSSSVAWTRTVSNPEPPAGYGPIVATHEFVPATCTSATVEAPPFHVATTEVTAPSSVTWARTSACTGRWGS